MKRWRTPLISVWEGVDATPAEAAVPRPGDDLVAPADVVLDRAFSVAAAPAHVWPWLVQLGKGRAGWYLPRGVERVIPRSHRASRTIDPGWQGLHIGDVVPDYGGPNESFEVAAIDAPHSLVYTSRRGRTDLSWSITLEPRAGGTRVFLRLRLAPVRRKWLANTLGELLDKATILGMAAGLRERVGGS